MASRPMGNPNPANNAGAGWFPALCPEAACRRAPGGSAAGMPPPRQRIAAGQGPEIEACPPWSRVQNWRPALVRMGRCARRTEAAMDVQSPSELVLPALARAGGELSPDAV